ncbi:lycopene cyclase domain-containing protein [Agromyces sp. H3Y2-19a]|jgi:lycopene cyclase domain-containing protein|uniref:lycopene cyclase domain-containing protein n=1 Tax=Agromyces TaxID=33877 RepID=UPI001E2A2E24|nr:MULTISPECIES: lycopene cyclase domain-containing protein [Agromyces]MCD5345263.1 lycopene cyclase domain-containing protein [Agromyces sp. S2-1-8]MDF0513577.1 lycopene cyclase domain-containing protein [Agromyces chromiiresistens]
MTYLVLSAAFLAAAIAVAAVGAPRAPRRHWEAVLASGGILVVLTVLFDSVMIAAGLFDYGDAHIWGVRIWLAPVEDLAYPIAGVLLLSGLWNLLDGPRHAR